MADVRFLLRLDEHRKQRLDAVRERAGLPSATEVIRRALDRFCHPEVFNEEFPHASGALAARPTR